MPNAEPQHEDFDVAACVRAAVNAAVDRKALDLKVLHLAPVADFTDYFIVCSGSNERQVQAIAEGVDRGVRELKVHPLHVEGLSNAQWVLLDFGDFLVHVFDEERRDYYALDRLWGDATDVTREFLA